MGDLVEGQLPHIQTEQYNTIDNGCGDRPEKSSNEFPFISGARNTSYDRCPVTRQVDHSVPTSSVHDYIHPPVGRPSACNPFDRRSNYVDQDHAYPFNAPIGYRPDDSQNTAIPNRQSFK